MCVGEGSGGGGGGAWRGLGGRGAHCTPIHSEAGGRVLAGR